MDNKRENISLNGSPGMMFVFGSELELLDEMKVDSPTGINADDYTGMLLIVKWFLIHLFTNSYR